MASRRYVLWGIVFVSAFLAIGSICGGKPPDQLVGEWKVAYPNIKARGSDIYMLPGVYLKGDVTITIVFDGYSKYEEKTDGVRSSYGSYTLDVSRDPAWVDIVPKEKQRFGGVPSTPLVRGLIRLPNPDVIEMGFGWDGITMGEKRPASFEFPDTGVMTSLTKLK